MVLAQPSRSQKCNRQLFGDINEVHVVFDDLIIGGEDDAEHDSLLKLV